MHKKTHYNKLLNNISFKIRINSFIKSLYTYTFTLYVIYFLIILTSRLSALIPNFFYSTQINLITLLTLLLISFPLALITHKKPHISKSAKLVDKHHNSKDLFLTNTTIDDSFGEYQNIVRKHAEHEAKKVDPDKIIQIQYITQIRNLILISIIILLISLFLPQLDPFGKEKERKCTKQDEEVLKKINKSTLEKIKRIKKNGNDKNSAEIKKLLENTKKGFNTLKKSEIINNNKKIKAMQQELNSAWRKKNDAKLRDKIETNIAKQSFGVKNKEEENWKKELAENKFTALKKSAKALQKLAREISEMKDGKDKEEKKRQFRKKMKSLSRFFSSQLGSKSAQNAIKQALSQMNMKQTAKNRKAIQDALNNSMELMNRELNRLDQISQDIKDLEMAMEAAQLAKQLNQLNQLKNTNRENLEEMEDYAEFYKKMMSQCQECKNGCKKGIRGGGIFPGENKDAKMGVKKELSKSKLQPGKILMKWNVKSLGKRGDIKEEYSNSVKKIKQGVSEAILKEQVPPGYHKSIKKYFNSLK